MLKKRAYEKIQCDFCTMFASPAYTMAVDRANKANKANKAKASSSMSTKHNPYLDDDLIKSIRKNTGDSAQSVHSLNHS